MKKEYFKIIGDLRNLFNNEKDFKIKMGEEEETKTTTNFTEISLENGEKLYIEEESIEVGVKVYPADGEYVLENGDKFIIEKGSVIEFTPLVDGEEEEQSKEEQSKEEQSKEEQSKEFNDLKLDYDDLKLDYDDLKEQFNSYKEDVEKIKKNLNNKIVELENEELFESVSKINKVETPSVMSFSEKVKFLKDLKKK
jgi:hypothetical protein